MEKEEPKLELLRSLSLPNRLSGTWAQCVCRLPDCRPCRLHPDPAWPLAFDGEIRQIKTSARLCINTLVNLESNPQTEFQKLGSDMEAQTRKQMEESMHMYLAGCGGSSQVP